MDDRLVQLEVHDGTATVTLDSPRNRNALSAQLRSELADSLARATVDEAVRVVVLTHTGTVFCAGADLKEVRTSATLDDGPAGLPAILEALWESPKPVVARLAGPARAGGLGLVSACDFAVAAADVTFAFTEVRIGVVPAIISATVLPRMVAHAAYELFLTGEPFDARRAAETGLITRAVPADLLDDEVRRFAGMLALGAPGALAATKRMLRAPRPPSLREDLADKAALSTRHFGSEEGQEGIRAFLEKRPPSWAVRG
jgi:methylglutaconyl-CoA hydratase